MISGSIRRPAAPRSAGSGAIASSFSAEGWSLSIEADGQRRIAPATHLVFPLELGGKDRRLRCRPANPPVGSFRVTTQPGSARLGGRFLVELATCESIDTGNTSSGRPGR